MSRACRCLNCIMPPHILSRLLESKNEAIRASALNTLLTPAGLRGERRVNTSLAAGLFGLFGDGRRTIYDARHRSTVAGASRMRTETGPASSDLAVNRAFEGLG